MRPIVCFRFSCFHFFMSIFPCVSGAARFQCFCSWLLAHQLVTNEHLKPLLPSLKYMKLFYGCHSFYDSPSTYLLSKPVRCGFGWYSLLRLAPFGMQQCWRADLMRMMRFSIAIINVNEDGEILLSLALSFTHSLSLALSHDNHQMCLDDFIVIWNEMSCRKKTKEKKIFIRILKERINHITLRDPI